VAYAPHRAIDVADLGADWYLYSTYKVFGPHMAALFGRDEAFAELEGPNHFFIDRDDVPYKFEPGGVCHEGCAGLLGLWPYLAHLAGLDPAQEPSRKGIVDAFATVTVLEAALQTRLLGWLRERPDLSIIGPPDSDASRVATVSFAHKTRLSSAIAKAANARHLGIRWGHFYAHRLCQRLASLGLVHSAEDGVVRASLLHYNVVEEIDRVIEFLDTLS
jgi:selenocysteine lyase/cysteine desulfurase